MYVESNGCEVATKSCIIDEDDLSSRDEGINHRHSDNPNDNKSL